MIDDQVIAVIEEAIQPAHYFVSNGLALEWPSRQTEDISWEIFHGRLLDPAHTRESRQFVAWNIYARDEAGPSGEPIISVKLDPDAGRIHVTRAIHCHAWEGYDSGNNVYLSREVPKWVRELVGVVALEAVSGPWQRQ